MKKIFFPAAVLLICSSFAFSSSVKENQKNKNSKQETKVETADKAVSDSSAIFKDILYKLIKQDERIDESFESIKLKRAALNSQDLDTIISGVRSVKKNLDEVYKLNSAQLETVNQNPQNIKLTKTVIIYSAKIEKKIAAVIEYVEKESKTAFRNAPSSKNSKVKGKKLSTILKQQDNRDTLKKELLSLKKSSSKVKASSKWLYYACK